MFSTVRMVYIDCSGERSLLYLGKRSRKKLERRSAQYVLKALVQYIMCVLKQRTQHSLHKKE